jgi:LAS superfamily LD-carboxypeptidase LdcB
LRPQQPRNCVSSLAMSYEENRVTTKVYGTLKSTSELLVIVPGVGGKRCRLHKLAAAALAEMAAAVKSDLDIELALASAWRDHRWKSYEDYEQTVIKKYGSVAEGRKWLAFSSPHETGLAMDIGVGGLTPSRATAEKQKQQPLHKWLVEHAYEYGWHPYKREPWHWEYPLSLAAYKSGVDDGEGPPPAAVSFGIGADEDEDPMEDEDLDEC